MKEKKIELLSPFRYVIPAHYEEWFEDLAGQGWHPQKVGQWSSLAMTFVKGEPKKYRYVVDMQAHPRKEYTAAYEAFGWELVGQMASAFVWRKEYTEERPQSFNDKENIVARNKRFISALSVSLILFAVAALITTLCFIWNFKQLKPGDVVQFILGLLLTYSLTAYLGSVMWKLFKNKNI